MEGFRFYLQTRNLTAPTIKNYVTVGKQWQRWCDENQVDPVKATTVQLMNWLGFMSVTRLPSTIRLYTLAMRVYFDYLKSLKMVKANPARNIEPGKQISRPVTQLELHEVRALIGACDTLEDRAMLLLLIGGGLRRSELMGIKREDIDFDRGTIRVYGKGRKWREVAPGKAAMEAAKLAIGWKPRLFTSEHPDWIRRRLNTLAEKAGVEKRIHPHMLRYFFAVSFCEAGGGIDLLQTILGHSSLEMSMHYSRAGRERRALQAQRQFNPADALLA